MARTSAVTTSLTGAVSPTSRAAGGIAPLITPISHGRPASTSRSIDGRAPAIFSPNARARGIALDFDDPVAYARATANASLPQADATCQADGSASTSPIVRSSTAHVPLKVTLKISFSHTSC